MNKPTLTKEQAEAIDLFLEQEGRHMKQSIEQVKAVLVAEHYGQDWSKYEVGQYEALNGISTFDLMKCLVDGYTVEQTPEEKVRELFEMYSKTANSAPYDQYDPSPSQAIISTLNLLNIQIEGVNK